MENLLKELTGEIKKKNIFNSKTRAKSDEINNNSIKGLK